MGAILQYGLSVALVGISTVFVGLIILIGLIKLMEMIMTGGKGKKKARVVNKDRYIPKVDPSCAH